MRLTLILGIVALVAVLGPAAFAADEALDLSQFIANIDQLIARLDQLKTQPQAAEAVANSLPDAWNVRAEEREFRVGTSWLKEQLRRAKQTNQAEPLNGARRRLLAMRSEAAGYDRELFEAASQHAALEGILARSEFRSVHGPTWLDRLKQRIFEFLLRLMGRIFGSSSFPTVSRAVAWTLVAIAVVVLAISVYRAIRQSARFESIMPEPLPVSAKEWSVWLKEARAAAARDQWREAIHLAYWAGISLLEARGMWRPDRARTPREYLRLLGASSEFHPALSALTRRFEVVWYGYSPADQRAYAQTLAELEKLGCR